MTPDVRRVSKGLGKSRNRLIRFANFARTQLLHLLARIADRDAPEASVRNLIAAPSSSPSGYRRGRVG